MNLLKVRKVTHGVLENNPAAGFKDVPMGREDDYFLMGEKVKCLEREIDIVDYEG